jgi:hypothetical protein
MFTLWCWACYRGLLDGRRISAIRSPIYALPSATHQFRAASGSYRTIDGLTTAIATFIGHAPLLNHCDLIGIYASVIALPINKRTQVATDLVSVARFRGVLCLLIIACPDDNPAQERAAK